MEVLPRNLLFRQAVRFLGKIKPLVAVVPIPVEQPTRQLVWVKEPAVLAMVRAPARELVKVSVHEAAAVKVVAIKDLAPRNKAAAQVVAVVPTPVEQPTRQLV
jgi:hypothetical protein